MQNKTILLVEDNLDDEALTLRAFKNNNIKNQVKVVHDGQEALDYFFGEGAHSNPKPAIVLLDINLPKVNGLEVLKKIRGNERTALQPVVILTSSKEEQDIVAGYKLGANSYVRKPVDFAQFMEAVRELGLYWLVMNDAPIQHES